MKEELITKHHEEKPEDEGMEKHKKKNVVIIVNGVKRETKEKKLSFEDIVVLAFGQYDSADNIAYTVVYSFKKGHHNNKGVLVSGDSVKVREGMVLNVAGTTRS